MKRLEKKIGNLELLICDVIDAHGNEFETADICKCDTYKGNNVKFQLAYWTFTRSMGYYFRIIPPRLFEDCVNGADFMALAKMGQEHLDAESEPPPEGKEVRCRAIMPKYWRDARHDAPRDGDRVLIYWENYMVEIATYYEDPEYNYWRLGDQIFKVNDTCCMWIPLPNEPQGG